MTVNQILESMQAARTPADRSQAAIAAWHSHQDALSFLNESADGEVPLYAGHESMFVYGVLVQLTQLKDDYIDDILRYNLIVPSGYGYEYSFSDSIVTPELSRPMGDPASRVLNASVPIFFHRCFPGVDEAPPIEINQPLAHIMGLYTMPDRQAWCNMSERGEIVPVAQYRRVHSGLSGVCCTVRRTELDVLMYITKCCIVRVFDFTRSHDRTYDYSCSLADELVRDEPSELHARRRLYGRHGVVDTSVLRGFQVLRCTKSDEHMSRVITRRLPRQYATFRIHDFKNRRVVEWSSAPDQLGNYFVESDLPFQTSPAFFRPEVLMQYRQDPSRYVIEERIARCKGAWQVRYDVNEEGLVFAYIADLGDLPYEEQLRWKAFNVEPKGSISQRALRTDFIGEWDDSYDALRSLKDILARFPTHDSSGRPCPVWSMPALPVTRDVSFLGYVLTDARKEWEDQILALQQILVEGLNTVLIAELAEQWGCREAGLGSIRQLERVMKAAQIPHDERQSVVEVLAEVHELRSAGVAHTGGRVPAGDLRSHYRDLLRRCDAAMGTLASVVRAGKLLKQ